MDITYTLSLTVTRRVTSWDDDVTTQEAADWMVSREATRELEKEVLQALGARCSAGCRKLEGDCDVEVMMHEQVGTVEAAS